VKFNESKIQNEIDHKEPEQINHTQLFSRLELPSPTSRPTVLKFEKSASPLKRKGFSNKV